MTTTESLRRRLDKLAPEGEEPIEFPDLSVLSAAEQDRERFLARRWIDGKASDAELVELVELYKKCPPERPEGPRNPPIDVPRNLCRHWRFARMATAMRSLPNANYDFRLLGFVARERLMELSELYGWERDSAEINIMPIDAWIREISRKCMRCCVQLCRLAKSAL